MGSDLPSLPTCQMEDVVVQGQNVQGKLDTVPPDDVIERWLKVSESRCI